MRRRGTTSTIPSVGGGGLDCCTSEFAKLAKFDPSEGGKKPPKKKTQGGGCFSQMPRKKKENCSTHTPEKVAASSHSCSKKGSPKSEKGEKKETSPFASSKPATSNHLKKKKLM